MNAHQPLFIVVYLSFVLLALAQAGKFRRFQEEIIQDDLEIEDVLRNRALRVKQVCNKYSDISLPESFDKRLNKFHLHYQNEKQMPIGDSVAFDGFNPKWQLCAPRQVLNPESLEKFKATLDLEFPSKIKGNLNDTKLIKKRMKMFVVSHPLERLVRSFVALTKVENDVILEKVKKTYGKFTFKEFVDFLVHGGKKFSGYAEFYSQWPLTSLWTPFYQNCPACNPDLFPDFVLKTGEDLETEYEVLQEIVGLEDIDAPKADAVSDTTLKMMYSQITKDDLDGLCDIYRVDMEMYQFSPAKFYSIVQ
ncbi:hypothetical protein TCAL_03564 [Tigriopus californicus]|uniref:Carbohydrate sulfotransferase n=1 Tax=Tigriopus californicus TaxID=6832 RepID=A0A553NCR6_TIGCA|nr:uncharacterized protein LOC131888428 [Tigriopus californicus]TRY63243.1 hypothetical protein TCAL_03564 [Tigriopus californicus]|eukprot:TCALIF_03564-PA protein Name:"Protein of unknown function" AED:0.00 eAED:0.00 QI:169/1/1/1/1/1/4/89/305